MNLLAAVAVGASLLSPPPLPELKAVHLGMPATDVLKILGDSSSVCCVQNVCSETTTVRNARMDVYYRFEKKQKEQKEPSKKKEKPPKNEEDSYLQEISCNFAPLLFQEIADELVRQYGTPTTEETKPLLMHGKEYQNRIYRWNLTEATITVSRYAGRTMRSEMEMRTHRNVKPAIATVDARTLH